MNLRKKEDTGNRKKHWIEQYGELALGELDMS